VSHSARLLASSFARLDNNWFKFALNEDQKKDIEKSFEDYLKMQLMFIYDDEVDSKLTPEYEKKNKDKGIRKNIKKTMEKDKNFNEIMGGLKVESVKFNKKNET